MNQAQTDRGSNRWRNLAIVLLIALALFSLDLAINRIFQVDEAQNVYMSRVAAFGQTQRFFTNGTLLILGPMAWIARHVASSEAIYTWDRVLFLAVFWANLFLIALNTGAKLKSRAFLYTLLAAATLAPLWDYGFEIRHDNLLLLILLSIWWVLRRSLIRPVSVFAVIGFLSACAQFVSFKAFLYWLPLGLIALVAPPPRLKSSLWRQAAAWASGFLFAILVAFTAYKASGTWESFLNGLRTSIGHSENSERFAPWISLNRLPAQMPLVTGMSAALLALSTRALFRDRRAALTWDGPLPESALMAGAFLILVINPVPYPYNLVLLVPFMFLAAVKWIPALQEVRSGQNSFALLAGGVVLFAHALPFAIQTSRHLDFTNSRQEQLMDLAEAMTDPARDQVYDASGLVATRDSIHYQWFLHSLVMPKMATGQIPTLRAMLSQNPASVLIASYRTDWLSDDDRAYIAQHYLPLADDFYVLGAALPEGGGTFDCLHPGRYAIALPEGGHAPLAVLVDGRPLPETRVISLDPGPHIVQAPAGVKAAVLWLGPSLNEAKISDADHRSLFINWY